MVRNQLEKRNKLTASKMLLTSEEINHNFRGRTKSWMMILAALLLSFWLGLKSSDFFKNIPSEEKVSEVREGGYKFTNPLLECEWSKALQTKELGLLKKELKEFVIRQTENKKANRIAIYLRDLNNGPWTGINERDDYTPASLGKVPVLMAYFRLAEADRQVLNKKIKFEGKISEQNIPPPEIIQPGEFYTVEDLINRMIIYSDNNAYLLLYKNMDVNLIKKLDEDLGVGIGEIWTNPGDFMSVKNYASYFRILFNASYLNKETSERALELLSRSEFKDGIVAGVPQDVLVSHKFGERSIEGSETKQLHDCGIVYYPGRPYLLCIMTRGDDFKKLAEVIKGASSLIYNQIKSQD